MPLHARGAYYFGKVANFMKCPISHEELADKIYEQMLSKEGQKYGTQTGKCENCQTIIVVSARPNGEWETRYFPAKKQEEEMAGASPERRS